MLITGSTTATSAVEIDEADLVFEKPTDPDEYIEAIRSIVTES